MSPSTSSPAADPVRRHSVLRWVLLSIFSYQLVTFGAGLFALAASTGSMNNKFSDIAVDQFRWYLVGNNLEVFAKAYLPLTLAFTLGLYPLVSRWLRKKSRVTRWAIIWRTTLLCVLVTTYFTLRMIHTRPWLLSGLDQGHWYFIFRDSIPEMLRPLVFTFLLEVLPYIAAISLAVFYLHRMLRWKVPHWPDGARISTAGLTVASLTGVAWAVPAWHYRINEKPREDTRPNVLILASDSLRADHLSCNGYSRPTSPTIDELASRSLNFTNCFTPIASTVESLTTIMSSQYPHTHGLQHMFPNRQQVENVNEHAPSMARVLRDQGYDTAVMGDWCAGVFDMLPMGFEKISATTFDNFKVYMSQAVYLAHPAMPLYFDNPVGYWLFPKLECSAFYVTPDVVTKRVVDRLAVQSRSRQPFFWTVFYSCTHIPYTSTYEYAKKFTNPDYNGPHKHQFKFNVDEWIGNVDTGDKWRAMKKDDVDQIIGLYDGCVNKFDDCVRRVVAQLKATGQLDNTIILITGDHGDDLFEPNCTFGHGLTFNGGDQNTHIPAILYVPGKEKQARKIDHVVRSLDFAPTLLEAAGLAPDPRMEGVSLAPFLNDEPWAPDLAYFGETSYLFCRRYIPGEEPLHIPAMDSTTHIDESFNCHFVLKDKYQDLVLQTKERCLRTDHWKLVFTPGAKYDIIRLYDLANDPHCEKDVKVEYPEVFAAMKPALWAWMKDKKESRISDIFPNGEPLSRGTVAAATKGP